MRSQFFRHRCGATAVGIWRQFSNVYEEDTRGPQRASVIESLQILADREPVEFVISGLRQSDLRRGSRVCRRLDV
eukprot:5226460-Prymnesium_polylepis.2